MVVIHQRKSVAVIVTLEIILTFLLPFSAVLDQPVVLPFVPVSLVVGDQHFLTPAMPKYWHSEKGSIRLKMGPTLDPVGVEVEVRTTVARH